MARRRHNLQKTRIIACFLLYIAYTNGFAKTRKIDGFLRKHPQNSSSSVWACSWVGTVPERSQIRPTRDADGWAATGDTSLGAQAPFDLVELGLAQWNARLQSIPLWNLCDGRPIEIVFKSDLCTSLDAADDEINDVIAIHDCHHATLFEPATDFVLRVVTDAAPRQTDSVEIKT